METAVRHAHQLTHQAINRAVHWQLGQGHGPVAPQ
jgi:hydroxymethylpyrimidine/phosphomethylpyrimidine kinase